MKDKEDLLIEYRELLIQNHIMNKKSPNTIEHKQVNKRLLGIELKITSKEIIENTRIAFSII